MKKFILTTRSESCDDYMYFIEHPEKPTNEEINKFLMKYGSDRDGGENIEMLEELESFQRLKPNKKLGITDEELLDLYNKGFNDELLGYRSLEPSEFKSALEKAAYFHGKAIAFFGDDQPSLDYKSNEEILKTIKSKIK